MRNLLIILITILISGCETTTVQPETPSTPDEQAVELFQRGEFLLSGREFLRLSENNPDQATLYKLWGAYAYIQAMEYEDASAILTSIQPGEENIRDRQFHSLLTSKIELENGNPQAALAISKTVLVDNLSQDQIELLFTTRSLAFEKLSQNYYAAKELIDLDNLRINANQEPKFTFEIWRYLIDGKFDEVGNLGDLSAGNLIAWIELANITKSYLSNTEEFVNTINVWQQLNPAHPANEKLIAELVEISENFDSTPDQIALLLPLSGIYERYSEKIRDGFLTAWFNEKNYRPHIKIYNTDNNDILEIYSQAVADGADFIVGPLDKNAVARLSGLETIPVRTLALNQVDSPENTRNTGRLVPLYQFVQFGLPPEDEARQVAQRGILEGYNRSLVVTSNDEFGNRVFNAFSKEWSAMGGKVLEKVEYDTRTTDFVTPIKKLLNIDSSEERFRNLRQRLSRNILYESRLREDAEFIFIVGSNLTARQIVPHLRFFRAESVPIYTISSIYTGKQNPQVDSDLNGVEFVDVPWLLNNDPMQANLAAKIQHNWVTESTVLPRYYAFGVDAFNLISKIGELMLKNGYKFQGETGQLFMTDDGKIRRNLLWARFENGIPVPLSAGNLP